MMFAIKIAIPFYSWFLKGDVSKNVIGKRPISQVVPEQHKYIFLNCAKQLYTHACKPLITSK